MYTRGNMVKFPYFPGTCSDGTLVCGENTHCHGPNDNECHCTIGYEGDAYLGCTGIINLTNY